MKRSIFLSLIMLLSMGLCNAETDTTNQTVAIDQWLVAGPVSLDMPLFANQNSVNGKKFKATDLLKLKTKEVKSPKEGELFLIRNNKNIIWKKIKTKDSGAIKLQKPKDDKIGESWLTTQLFTDRFVKIKLEIETRQCFELYVDGVKKSSKYSATNESKKADKKTTSFNLERGSHQIVIKTLYNPEDKGSWDITTHMTYSKNLNKDAILSSPETAHFMDIDHLLNGKHLQDVSVSTDGKMVMLRYNEVFAPNGKTESWFEVRDRNSNTLIYSSEYADVSFVQWVPKKEAISFKAAKAGIDKLIMLDLSTMKQTVLLDNLKKTGYYQWSPTGEFLIYTINEKPKKDKDGVIHVVNMMDRWPWWRTRSQLFKLNIADLSVERITYGYLSANLQDIRKDGKKLLFSQSIPDFTERPFTRQILMEVDLESLTYDTIWDQRFGGQSIYSPDGKKLLVTGSAAMFNGTGVNVPEKMIPNDYDTQAYIYDLKSKTATCISKDFDPAIQGADWCAFDNDIYFKVEEKSWNKLYRYDTKAKNWKNLNAQVDMVNSFDVASDGPVMVYYGSNMQYPKTAWTCNTDGSGQLMIDNPEKEFFADVTFGKTENWSFKNSEGRTIEGRVYFPPDYDDSKKYPVIVYYYGGTSPTGRSFRGRYPKNLFAAQGYIVYVLQPSGATGFGQEFSALHVNDWGETVADEIILGTKTFLKEHPSANPKKVGCIGASYGGFMTMLLTTRTDIYAAAIEHAGISSISSYWGEGYWGYLYSSVASANSFPWNNRALYVNQSPLFHADKVNTPLLLLHGKADTNVPVGESIQMFTALKLLGKTVELVEIEGQDHHIMDYKKRVLWQKTIFAWFDKWLKDQPQWWNHMYPKEDL